MAETATAAELIDRAVEAGVVPGAVLAAGRGQPEPLLQHVAGDAQRDADTRRPMTAGTVFDLASLTKVVATLPAVLQLAGRAAVGLDEPVRRYLPAFAGPGKDQVTVRQLLLHTSGLPDGRKYYRRLQDPAQIRAAVLAEPLVARPGEVSATPTSASSRSASSPPRWPAAGSTSSCRTWCTPRWA